MPRERCLMCQALDAMDEPTLRVWAQRVEEENTRLRNELLAARVDHARIAELEAIIEKQNAKRMRGKQRSAL